MTNKITTKAQGAIVHECRNIVLVWSGMALTLAQPGRRR